MTAFERLDGFVDMYILRVFPPFSSEDETAVFDRAIEAKQVISFFETHETPYRLLIPVCTSVSITDAEEFAEYLLGLKMIKSVMIDFSYSELSEDEQAEFKSIFLKRKIPLY